MRPLGMVLIPLSWLYAGIIWMRNVLYDLGMLRTEAVSVPVVSVGNLTAGGTGKTPMVEYLVRLYRDSGRRTAVISRGYGRTTKGTVIVSDGEHRKSDVRECGDEPVQIARKFPGVIVIADERRARGARRAVDQYHADVILLDDGFQHRALRRDLDIVMIDAPQGLRGIRMLPAGLKREPASSLGRAGLLALTGCADDCTGFIEREELGGFTTIVLSMNVTGVHALHGERHADPATLRGVPCTAFCGIGNPDGFGNTLRDLGVDVQRMIVFRDHHLYTGPDITRIFNAHQQAKTDIILTTEKDAVRVRTVARDKHLPLDAMYYITIEAGIRKGMETLMQSVMGVLRD